LCGLYNIWVKIQITLKKALQKDKIKPTDLQTGKIYVCQFPYGLLNKENQASGNSSLAWRPLLKSTKPAVPKESESVRTMP
jgi:hypothetical protein